MEQLKQHSLLLYLLASLMLLKFLAVPVFEWQQDKLADISLLEQRRDKIKNVVENHDTAKLLQADLNKALENLDAVFFEYEEEALFKIELLKLLEEQMKKHKIVAKNIGLEEPVPFSDTSILMHQVNISFEGKTLDAAKFFYGLESFDKRLDIADFNINIKKQKANNLGKTSGRMVVNVYSKQVASNLNDRGEG